MQPNFLHDSFWESGDDIMEGLSNMDRISNFPEFILHHIMSSLPFKQVVQTSVLSQAWERAWRTFPVLEFDRAFFKQVPSVSRSGGEREARMQEEKLSKVLTYVEETLHTRHKEMIRLHKFTLDLVQLRKLDFRPFVDRCILSALDCDVKELKLTLPFDSRPRASTDDPRAHTKWFYSLPQEFFCSKSIEMLSLNCCTLLPPRIVKLSSLRKLCLTGISAANLVLERLLAGCPLIEHLKLDKCLVFKNLELSGLTKLIELYINHIEELQWLCIKALNVQTVVIQGPSPQCKIDVTSCKNIKSLTLFLSSLTDEWLCNQIPSFPFLERLNLSCDKLKSIEISSFSLKILLINECMQLTEAKIEAPNLSIFKYFGDVISFSLGAMTLSETHLCIETENRDIEWYAEYIKLLATFHSVSKVVNLQSKSAENVNIPEDLRQIQSSPFYGYDYPDYALTSPPVRLAIKNIIDGLLWISPHSKTVLVRSFFTKRFSFKFEFSYKKQPVYEEGIAQCCKPSPISCWQQCIEEVAIEYTYNGDKLREGNNVKRYTFKCEDIWEKMDCLADLHTLSNAYWTVSVYS